MKRSCLEDLVAAEREHAPRPDEDTAKASWRRLQRSLAAGTAAPFDLPPALVAPAPTGLAPNRNHRRGNRSTGA